MDLDLRGPHSALILSRDDSILLSRKFCTFDFQIDGPEIVIQSEYWLRASHPSPTWTLDDSTHDNDNIFI